MCLCPSSQVTLSNHHFFFVSLLMCVSLQDAVHNGWSTEEGVGSLDMKYGCMCLVSRVVGYLLFFEMFMMMYALALMTLLCGQPRG